MKEVALEAALEAARQVMAEQARQAPGGALNATQAFKFLGVRRTRFFELLKVHPELDAMAVTLTTRVDGKKIRRWPLAALNAWMQRQSRADLRLRGRGCLILPGASCPARNSSTAKRQCPPGVLSWAPATS